jgi:hypothetical protein
MPGRPLKNYDGYLDKIKTYCEACQIALEFRDVPGDGMYVPTLRKIVIDRDLPESTELATLLHELSHSMDDSLSDKKMMKKLNKAYPAFYKGTATTEQKRLVVDCETRAWVFARSLAKRLRIPLGVWFTKEEIEALADYRGETNE